MTDTLPQSEIHSSGPSPEDIEAVKKRIDEDERLHDYPVELIDELGSTVVGLWNNYLDHQLNPSERSRRQLVSSQVSINRQLGAASRYHIEQQAIESLKELDESLANNDGAINAKSKHTISTPVREQYRPDRRRRNWSF